MEFEKSSKAMVDFFDKIAPREPDVERKKLFGYPACFINGNMFTGLHGNKLLVRLDEKERAAFLENEGTAVFEPMPGRPMREYAVASAAMLADAKLIARWIAASAEYARKLPAKEKKARKGRSASGG